MSKPPLKSVEEGTRIVLAVLRGESRLLRQHVVKGYQRPRSRSTLRSLKIVAAIVVALVACFPPDQGGTRYQLDVNAPHN
ncbi:MAG: hypothetical protein O3B42_09425, partial [Actinomycetota bacterium]|nr:hypothetical protein [Actinomycetota bacterium]